MSGDARTGFGVKLGIETVTPGTFDDVAQLISVGDFEMSGDTLETTTHDTTGKFREFIAGSLLDTGEISGEAYFTNDADAIAIRELLVNRTKKKIRITFPTSPAISVTVPAIVTKFAIKGGEMEDAMTYSFSFKPSGEPVWA